MMKNGTSTMTMSFHAGKLTTGMEKLGKRGYSNCSQTERTIADICSIWQIADNVTKAPTDKHYTPMNNQHYRDSSVRASPGED